MTFYIIFDTFGTPYSSLQSKLLNLLNHLMSHMHMERVSASVWPTFLDTSGRTLDEYSIRKWTFYKVTACMIHVIYLIG